MWNSWTPDHRYAAGGKSPNASTPPPATTYPASPVAWVHVRFAHPPSNHTDPAVVVLVSTIHTCGGSTRGHTGGLQAFPLYAGKSSDLQCHIYAKRCYAARMRLAGYLRVSTEQKAEKGLGLNVQGQAMKEWAKQNGHRIVSWHTDAGVSGSNGLDTRIGLPDALDAVRSRHVEGVVVYRLDRLARDLIVQETLLADIRRMGGEIFSTAASEDAYLKDDPADPSRKLIRQVLGAVSEYERAMIALRLRSGRRRKAEEGGFAYGSPAYGYVAVGGELFPEEREQTTVQRIRALRTDGLSLRQIAAQLDEEGHKPKRGEHWSAMAVKRVLDRELSRQ